MEKKQLHDESFQPLSRGYRKHLRYKTSNQVKFYVYCLCRVKAVGDGKGEFSIEDVPGACDELNWNIKLFYKTLKELDEKYLKVKMAKSRHEAIRIKILKYKNVEDFYSTGKRKSNGKGKPKTTVPKSGKVVGKVVGKVGGTVTGDKSGIDNQLPVSNKVKKVKKVKKVSKSHSPEPEKSGDLDEKKIGKDYKKKPPEDLSLQTKIVDAYWLIAEQHTGKKPVWQRQGAKNYPLMFKGLAALKQPIETYNDVFKNGFEDKWHSDKMSPSWALDNFNVLLNLKNKKKSPTQQIAKSGTLSEQLKQRTERILNAEQERGCGEVDTGSEEKHSGNNGVPAKEQTPCEYKPGENLF